MSTTNLIKHKVEQDLKNQIEVRISFELLREWGISKLGPILFPYNIVQLEELLGNDKHFYLENGLSVLVVRYKDDCISILSDRSDKSNNKLNKE